MADPMENPMEERKETIQVLFTKEQGTDRSLSHLGDNCPDFCDQKQ
jgi:hypothetical protein